MKLLTISGSLRAASINSAFCRAVARMAPAQLQVVVWPTLANLPLFNPDLESDLPQAVRSFRAAIAQADALLIASPEYAHGISGPMKNALDWLVSFEGIVFKPIVLINTAPRSHHAYDALREVLQTMSTHIVPEASAAIPLLGYCTTENAMVRSAEVSRSIRAVLQNLISHLTGGQAASPSFPLT